MPKVLISDSMSNIAQKVFEKNIALKAEKKKYELIKKGLMQDLLTGKVRVN